MRLLLLAILDDSDMTDVDRQDLISLKGLIISTGLVPFVNPFPMLRVGLYKSLSVTFKLVFFYVSGSDQPTSVLHF